MNTKRTPLETKIKQSRVELLFKNPFFGTFLLHLPMVDATDEEWCPTAAIDGRKIYFNRNFVNSLDHKELQFVLCHEVMHVALDHLTRKGHRDMDYWNMATDYVINGILVEDKIGKMPTIRVPVDVDTAGKKTTAQRVGLYDARYSGLSSEQVYEDLMKRKVKKEITLDVHLTGDGAEKGKQNSKMPSIPVSEEELSGLRNDIKNKILQAANAAAGKIPAGIKRLIDDMLEPRVNWRDLIKQSVQSCITADFTWMRPNRKHMYGGIFLPTLKKDETISIQIAIDMSGSITDKMGKDFLSEIYGIMTQYSDFTLGLLTFDTQVYNYREFTSENVDEFLHYELKGGGGTDFECFWNHWIENKIEPKLAVVFTDGYPNGSWGPSNYCNTLWIITEGTKTKVKPPFGTYAYYSHQDGIEEIGEM